MYMKRVILSVFGFSVSLISMGQQFLYTPNGELGVSTNQYIGVGTNSPQSQLEILSQSPNIRIRDTNSGISGKSFIQFGQTESGIWSRTGYIGDGFNGSRDIGIFVDQGNFGIGVGSHPINSPQFFINHANVGISTTNPTAKLHVNCSSGTAFKVEHISNSDWEQASVIKINRDKTKALSVYNEFTNEEVFAIWGNGVLNARKVYAEEVEIRNDALGIYWADYVFSDEYSLKSLSEVESFIEEHNHLPGIPSSEEVKKNGIEISKMQALLLEKIEELTLYIIEQDKLISTLSKR